MEIIQDCLVSKIRDRDAVLGAIVPKILGILRARGLELHGFGGRSVQLTEAIVLSTSAIDAHRLMISVCHGPTCNLQICSLFFHGRGQKNQLLKV
jgi:hypothetical protein